MGELNKALEPRNPAAIHDKWRHDWVRAIRLRELLPYQPPRPRPPVDTSFLRAAPAEQRPIIASENASGDTAVGVPEIVDDPSPVGAPLALSATEDRTAAIIAAIGEGGPLSLYIECMILACAELGGTEACDKMRKADVADAMERAIRPKWPAGLSASPSRRDAEKMASLVRSPKAKEGGRKSQG